MEGSAGVDGKSCDKEEPGFSNQLTRRRLLKSGAAAAAGMVASAVLPRAAQASDGDALLVGRANDGTSETSLTASLSGSVMRVESGSAGGVGLKAVSLSGVAVEVVGKARFSRSGVTSISRNQTSRTVTGLSDVVSIDSMILATLQGSAGPDVVIRYATRVSSTSIEIALNKPATRTVRIAWFIIEK